MKSTRNCSCKSREKREERFNTWTGEGHFNSVPSAGGWGSFQPVKHRGRRARRIRGRQSTGVTQRAPGEGRRRQEKRVNKYLRWISDKLIWGILSFLEEVFWETPPKGRSGLRSSVAVHLTLGWVVQNWRRLSWLVGAIVLETGLMVPGNSSSVNLELF